MDSVSMKGVPADIPKGLVSDQELHVYMVYGPLCRCRAFTEKQVVVQWLSPQQLDIKLPYTGASTCLVPVCSATHDAANSAGVTKNLYPCLHHLWADLA